MGTSLGTCGPTAASSGLIRLLRVQTDGMNQWGSQSAVVTARVRGDHLVHLVVPEAEGSLCGQALRPLPPRQSFRVAGCPQCLSEAVRAGYAIARDGDQTWINLGRILAVS
jgi:hypothetical protein